MADRTQNRKGVQPDVVRADPETTDGAFDGVEHNSAQPQQSGPAHGTSANDQREAEVVKKMPTHTDHAQERGERHESAKAISSGGKEAEQPKPRRS